MRVRWSPEEGLDLGGDHAEMRALHDLALATATGGSGDACVSADTHGDPAPYASFLSALEFRRLEGPLVIRVADRGVLEVTGGPESLKGFASFLSFDDAARPGAHSHVEFYEGHPFISPASEPLVVSLEGPVPT
jgi:hypothetical protein